ncbi:MAG TPA: hypothetical protein PK867_01190, partial [Pirellulales bacterium]|nr:hypothetical protein [Pirellulales bacterium]
MIRFTCDGCGKVYSGADELAGQQARCRQCGALFTVGAAQPAARPPARPASSAAPRPKPRTASPAARPARRPAQPLPEAPLPEAEVVSGFSLDLSALGPLDAPVVPVDPYA